MPNKNAKELSTVKSSNGKPESTMPSVMTLSPQQQSLLSQEAYELIKQRTLELVEILVESMAADPEANSMGLQAMAPVLMLVISNYENTKLVLLLKCLQGIVQAVLDSACSQDKYNDAMVPLIEGLKHALS